jgi:hypothetical protein
MVAKVLGTMKGKRMLDDSNNGGRHLQPPNIHKTLSRILCSPRFRDSVQLQTLLKYIVEKSVEGHEDALKERIIGIEVFGRKPDYDTADDPIVRSRVGLLRKRLAQYYESEEARDSELQIVVPNGSYRPTFVLRLGLSGESVSSPTHSQPHLAASDELEEPELGTLPSLPKSSGLVHWRAWAIIGVASCALLLAGWVAVLHWQESELYLLWKPVLESKRTVLLYTGTIGPVYLRSAGPIEGTGSPGDQELPAVPAPLSQLEAPAPNGRGFVPVTEGLAPPGDISADLKIAALMNTYNRNLSLRSGSGLPFVDLKGSPTVLIGAYDNYWTMDLAQGLPFYFDRGTRIRERGGQHRVWSTAAGPDTTITEDYAVFFRLLDSKTGGPVIAIAGLTTCGTQAAAEFATDPVQLRKIANIPRDSLKRKNLEFVLRASLVNCTPTSVDIVAQQVW